MQEVDAVSTKATYRDLTNAGRPGARPVTRRCDEEEELEGRSGREGARPEGVGETGKRQCRGEVQTVGDGAMNRRFEGARMG